MQGDVACPPVVIFWQLTRFFIQQAFHNVNNPFQINERIALLATTLTKLIQ